MFFSLILNDLLLYILILNNIPFDHHLQTSVEHNYLLLHLIHHLMALPIHYAVTEDLIIIDRGIKT